MIATGTDASILFVDVDPDSPERGARVPAIAQTIPPDRYTEGVVLAVAARPGWILAPDRTYAVVVRTGANDARGRPLAVSEAMGALAAGEAPEAAGGRCGTRSTCSGSPAPTSRRRPSSRPATWSPICSRCPSACSPLTT